MKTLNNIIFFFALFIAINGSSALQQSHEYKEEKDDTSSSWSLNYWKHKNGGHGDKDGGPYRPPAVKMTCDRFPRVCHVKGSPGPDCCKKSCVNVKKDRLNCGMCGNKCRYSEVCCKGTCVNPLRDRKNCGRCGNKCRRGSFCEYGMCSYA